jgi:hypothetical protein
MKDDCLFILFVMLRFPKPWHLLYHWKALDEQGCTKLVTQFLTYREKTIEY